MQQLRKWIRKPGLKLSKIYKRISQEENYALRPAEHLNQIKLSQSHFEGPLTDNVTEDLSQQLNKLEVGKCVISTALRDSCILLKNNKFYLVKNIIKLDDEIQLIVENLRLSENLYDVGVTSTAVKVQKCKDLETVLRTISLRDVKCKTYIMPCWSSVEGEERIIDGEWISLLEVNG